MDWQLFLVLLIAASSSAIAGLIVFFLGTFKIPPVLFFLGIYVIVFIFQTYFYAMYRSFKERKMKKLTLLAVILALFFILPYTAYAVRTPRWSFTVSTDKTIYMLGENVTITATLTNNGYITHSFTSIDKVPIQIYVQYSWFSIWYSDSNAGKTEFSIGPRESIQRTVVWNQTTWEHFGWGVSKLVPITTTGEYYVYAAIFDADGDSKLFRNWVKITIEE